MSSCSRSCAGSASRWIKSIGVPVGARICLDREGAVIARLPFEKILTSWALFYRALRRHLPDACYRPGMQLEDIVQDAGGVTAIFADGTQVDGDLLVGADGLHSTRAGARLPADPAPRYAGYVAWRGVIEEAAVPPAARELRESYGILSAAARDGAVLLAAGRRRRRTSRAAAA